MTSSICPGSLPLLPIPLALSSLLYNACLPLFGAFVYTPVPLSCSHVWPLLIAFFFFPLVFFLVFPSISLDLCSVADDLS